MQHILIINLQLLERILNNTDFLKITAGIGLAQFGFVKSNLTNRIPNEFQLVRHAT